MKNAKAVLSVKFNSIFYAGDSINVHQEDIETFKNVQRLRRKYYITEEFTEATGGIYIFETKSARAALWTSALAKSILARYSVISETLCVEQYEMAIVQNNIVLA